MKHLFSLCLLFCCTFLRLSAQETEAFRWEELGDSWEQWDISGVSKKPKGTDHLLLACSYSESAFQVIKEKNGKFEIIQKDSLDDFWYNSAKAYWDYTISNDTIYLPSQIPFKATIVTEIFYWDGKKLHHFEPEFEDNNWGKVETADSLLAAGLILESIEVIESVEYPHSYYNSEEFGKQVMEKAHEIALAQFKLKNYDSACKVMENGMSYWENDVIGQFATRAEFLKDKEERSYSDLWNEERIKLWIGDYGLFLYKANKLDECIKVNTWLKDMLPEVAGPCLQLADALYDKGKKKEASPIYKEYIRRMEKAGKSSSIPKRVKQRI